MNSEANHLYTQLLVVLVLSYEMKDEPWWHLTIAIVACLALAVIGSAIRGAK